jgi:hexosaminidase
MMTLMASADISIIPEPVELQATEGEAFQLTAFTGIDAPVELREQATHLRRYLRPATGFSLPTAGQFTRNEIELRVEPGLDVPEHGYTLNVESGQVTITGKDETGLFYGIQTLRQLLPPEIYSDERQPETDWTVPAVQITDYPRFGWRGLHVDVCRHFMPLDLLYQKVDLLAMHKMNRLHLHLTEDQGWRLEIMQYPKLTEVGAWRRETHVGHYRDQTWDGIPHGGYYTQDEMRELVDYAMERGIEVIPEIEMPGHSGAAVAAYPELGNTGEPIEVNTYWGVHEHIFNVEESTFEFLENVLLEVMDIFPSEFIHVGGDEAPKKQWEESEAAQAKMRELGLETEEELQSYFITRMSKFLESHGRRLVGWDEILEGGLAPNATVMSWRGISGGVEAANMGHDVVMAPTSHTYFDYYQSRDTESEPVAIGGFLPLERVYSFDPHVEEIPEDKRHHVLGVQGQLWSEYIPTPEHMEYMAFPRASALSEVAWSPEATHDFKEFRGRLQTHLERLDHLDVNYRPLDPFYETEVGVWRYGDYTTEGNAMTFELDKRFEAAGEYSVTMDFDWGNHVFEIDKVQVFDGDRLLATSDADGRIWWGTMHRVPFRVGVGGVENLRVVVTGATVDGNQSAGSVYVVAPVE